ncbi:MAG: Homocysteine S-methyltransferase [Phycisphaerae bacterium]|nr:Homocysteine S-methyltransferase [Phycisphaerae bacterium]
MLDKLAAGGPLVLDGAVGTELTRRGVATTLPLWSAAALFERPDVIQQIHRDYVHAGADIVVANTFRTNPRTLRRAQLEARGVELNALALDLARRAALGVAARKISIAASVAPVEDCYSPRLAPDEATLRVEHAQMREWLTAAGVELAWCETIGTLREARAAADVWAGSGVPFVMSFVTRESGDLLGGEPLEEAVRAIEPFGPAAIGVNCVPPAGIVHILRQLRDLTRLPLAAYGHIGNPEPICGWSFSSAMTPEEYARHAVEWLEAGARIVGGCCGTTPAHIAAVRRVCNHKAECRMQNAEGQ